MRADAAFFETLDKKNENRPRENRPNPLSTPAFCAQTDEGTSRYRGQERALGKVENMKGIETNELRGGR